MTIPAAALTNPIVSPNPRIPLVNVAPARTDLSGNQLSPDQSPPQQGQLSVTGLQVLQQMFTSINGMTPTIACNATNVSNLYTLTPADVSPRVPNYFDYWSFAFVASATSTGPVTATVMPVTGALPTLKVYKTHGSAQAGAGDITNGLFYVVYYVDSLDSGNGGFCII